MPMREDDLAEALGRELALLDSPAASKVLEMCFTDHVKPNARNRLWLICNAPEAPTVYADGEYTFVIIDTKGKCAARAAPGVVYLDYDYGKGKNKTPVAPMSRAAKMIKGVADGKYQVSELNDAVAKAFAAAAGPPPLPEPQPAPPPAAKPAEPEPAAEPETDTDEEPTDTGGSAAGGIAGHKRKAPKPRKPWYPAKRAKPDRVWVRNPAIPDQNLPKYLPLAIMEIDKSGKTVNVICAPGPDGEYHPDDRIETWKIQDLEKAYAEHPQLYRELWIQTALGVEVRSLVTNRLQYTVKGYELKETPRTEAFWKRMLGDDFDAVEAGTRRSRYW